MNGRFPVIVDGEWREVEIGFATEREVKRLAYWRIPQTLPNNAAVVRKIYDTVEFARLGDTKNVGGRINPRDGVSTFKLQRSRLISLRGPKHKISIGSICV